MIRIPKKKEQKIMVGAFFCCCLLCIGQYFGITALNLSAVAVLVALACIADVDELFVIMFMTLPLYNVISYRVGTYSMHYLVIGLFIVKYLFSTKISAYKLIVFLVLFLLRIFAEDFVLLVSWSLLILPLILTIDDPIWGKNLHQIIFWMNISMLLSCGVGYIMMLQNKSIYTNAYLYIAGIRTIRFAGLTGDSVIFGQSCVFIIAMNFVYSFFNPSNKRFYMVSSLLLAMATLFSFSKMTLFCIVLTIVLFLILYAKEYASRGKALLRTIVFAMAIIMAVFVTLLILLNYDGSSNLILGYIDRFTRADLSTGRFSLWGEYLKMLCSSIRTLFLPLTSDELSTPIWNASSNVYVTYVHNVYLETIAAFGWCTAVTIFLFFLFRLHRFVREGNKLILLLPIFVLMFMGISLHGNFEYQFYLQLALACAFLNPVSMESLIEPY